MATALQTQVHGVIFRYRSLSTLHAWLYSSVRVEMLVQLQPLLRSPDLITATRDRVLPDAFTDIFVASNSSAPLRPPPKWKVVVLTTTALWLVIYLTGRHFDAWLIARGLTNKYVRTPVVSMWNVALVSYAGVPLVTTVVGHWLAKPRAAGLNSQPFKALDQGLRSQWARSIVVACYFVPTIAFWVYNETKRASTT